MHAPSDSGGDTVVTSEAPASRRLVGPDPLEAGGCFGKPVGLVGIDFGDHHPTLFELKLRNIVLAESLRQLADHPGRRDFVARAALMRRAAGQHASRSNARLHHALDRLAAPIEGTLSANARVLILSSWERRDAEMVAWRLDEEIIRLLCDQKVWAWLDLGVCASFRRAASLLLYERFRLVANRDWPVLSLGIAELRGALGLTNQMTRGSDFLQKVIMPAVRDVEKICNLTISVTAERERRHGALIKIIFKLPPSSDRRRSEAKVSRRDPAAPLARTIPRPDQNADGRRPGEQQRAPVPRTRGALEASQLVAPPMSRGRMPKGLIFDRGIELLGGQDIPAPAARSFIAGLLSKYDDGYVAVILDRAWQRKDSLADVRSWMTRSLKRYPTRAAELDMRERRTSWNAPLTTQRPLATPENLGISDGLATKIQAANKWIGSFSIFADVTADDDTARGIDALPSSSPATEGAS